MTKITIFLVFIVIFISAAGFAAENWTESGCSNRAIVEVVPDKTAPESDLAYATIYHAGRIKPDGSDVLVRDEEGRIVDSSVEFINMDYDAIVVFKAKNDSKRYYVYFGNPAAPEAKNRWEPDSGLIMKVFKKPGDANFNPPKFEDAKGLFEKSPKLYGAKVQRYIWDSYNPFGDSGDAMLLYRGFIDVPEDKDYTFVVWVGNPFLVVDGKLIADQSSPLLESPYDQHTQLKQATIFLKKGRHKIEHYSTQSWSVLALTWKNADGKPGFGLVPQEWFAKFLKVRVVKYESKDGAVDPNFSYVREDFVWPFDRDGLQYTRVSFRDLSTEFDLRTPSRKNYYFDGSSFYHQLYYIYFGRFKVLPNSRIAFYLYIPKDSAVKEILLQFYTYDNESWNHRAYWGDNIAQLGDVNSYLNKSMGALPEAGKWVKLEIKAEDVNLAGKEIDGVSFHSYGGKCYFGKFFLEDDKGNFLNEFFNDDPPKTPICQYTGGWFWDYDLPFDPENKPVMPYPYECEWDFGDGIKSKAHNPGHVYLNQGTYEVTFKANGKTLKKTLEVKTEPLVSAYYRPGETKLYYEIAKDYDLKTLDRPNLNRFIDFSYDEKDYLKSTDACRTYFERFKKEIPDEAASRLTFGASILSQKDIQNYPAAVLFYSDASRTFVNVPLKLDSKLRMARLYSVYLDENEKAKVIYEEVLKEAEAVPDKNSVKGLVKEAFQGLGDYYIEKLDAELTRNFYNKAVELNGNTESKEKETIDLSSYPSMVIDFLESQDNETAFRTLDEWESKYPLHKMAGNSFFLRGKVFYVAGDYKAAIYFLNLSRLANNASPDMAEALFLMGDSYDKLKNKRSAAEFFSKIVLSYGGSPYAEKAKTRLKEYRGEEIIRLKNGAVRIKERKWKADRIMCVNNLRKIGQAILMYAQDHEDALPPLLVNPENPTGESGRYDAPDIYPKYIDDHKVFHDPAWHGKSYCLEKAPWPNRNTYSFYWTGNSAVVPDSDKSTIPASIKDGIYVIAFCGSYSACHECLVPPGSYNVYNAYTGKNVLRSDGSVAYVYSASVAQTAGKKKRAIFNKPNNGDNNPRNWSW